MSKKQGRRPTIYLIGGVSQLQLQVIAPCAIHVNLGFLFELHTTVASALHRRHKRPIQNRS